MTPYTGSALQRAACLMFFLSLLIGLTILPGYLSHTLTPTTQARTNFSRYAPNQEQAPPYVGAANGKAFKLQEKLSGVEIKDLKTTRSVFKAFGISSDGTKLLYTSLQRGIPSGELWLENLKTSRLQKISGDLVLEAAWSPANENSIAYTFASGDSFGLKMVELDSGLVTTLVRTNVFTELFQWDESGNGIHYFETTERDGVLQLTARFVAAGNSQNRSKSSMPVPVGFPIPAQRSFLTQMLSEEATFDSETNFGFRVLSSDGDHEVNGENLLGNGALSVQSKMAPAATNLGDGKLLKVLLNGIVVRRAISKGTKLEYVSFDGSAVTLPATSVNYNLPMSNAKLVQGGRGYSAPGNCQVGSHNGAMSFAYDLEGSVSAHVLAAADGLVVYNTSTVTCNTIDVDCPDFSSSGCPGTFLGNVIIVQHADGTYTKYAHMETDLNRTVVGTSVCQGLYIGRQGHTGTTNGNFNSCGDHLHFQRQTSPDIFGQSIAVDFSDVSANPLSCNTNYNSASPEVSHSIAPTAQSFGIPGGTGTVTVTSTGCDWTAVSNDSWLTITSPANGAGSGNGDVSFAVADNSASGFRVGTLTIAGQIFTVSQNGGGVTNQAPTVNAGTDATILLPNSAALNGSVVDDGLPNPPAALTITWSKVSGPGTVTFTDAHAPNTTSTFGLAGVYLLRLTADDGLLSSSDDVMITVNVANGGGALFGSLGATPATVNLTTEGVVDWAHWGLNDETSFVQKNGVASQISNFTKIGPITVVRLTGANSNYSWTDGTPTPASNTATGVYLYGTGNGFELTVPAGTTMRTLKLYLGVFQARGRLEATLSDGSSSPFVDSSLVNTTNITDAVYSLNFQSAAPATLTIKWTIAGDNSPQGQVRLLAATVFETSAGLLAASSMAAPATVNLTTEGTADWAHWGLTTATSFNHKAGVASQISNYTRIGPVGVKRQLQSPTSYSWTGGTPAATASNTTTGVYLTGNGNGFQLSVPADTTGRTLKLYLGVWSAQGKLEASLSDGSAPAVVDTGLINQTATSNAVYMLNYRAGTSGQTLTIKWTVNASFNSFGNITLQAATLSADGSPQLNQAPTVNAGNDQTINLPAGASLTGTASDDGLPNPPAAITNTWSQVSGPGTTTFGNANALNTSASFSSAGIYTLRLTVSDSSLSSSDDLIVTVNSAGGVLSVSMSAAPATVDLATEGTADWAHWGLTTATSFNHKAGVASQISNYTRIGSVGVKRQLQSPTSYSWTGGTPAATASNTTTGVYLTGNGNGFQLSVPADTTGRTLKLYLGVWSAQGKLEASLSDGSAPAVVDTGLINQTATSNAAYMLNYRAGTSGQTLTIKWTVNASFNSFCNITLQAATLIINNGFSFQRPKQFELTISPAFAALLPSIFREPHGDLVQ